MSHPLTPRERQVLRRLADGQSTREVARSLGIGYATVRVHRDHILRKLQTHSMPNAIYVAVKTGILR